MDFQSTRGGQKGFTSAQAITQGIACDGGLFVPSTIPKVSLEGIKSFADMTYNELANKIFSLFLTDLSDSEIAQCTSAAYNSNNFSKSEIAPVEELDDKSLYMLELWHGPTCAFKDMALQILPHFMRVAAAKTAEGKEIIILVATSGDTGKAALEGFKNAENTQILVFYPENGVSEMQKLQMMTQEGDNVSVCGIEGNFDDAQSGVKAIFSSGDVAKKLADNNMMFSSANSINWGRLVPQIVYYFSAYVDMMSKGAIGLGESINVVVPTGNFGNILAAYYAKMMGLPIKKLICASNSNNVLTDFINSGVYDRKRGFFETASPSMDILISSNLERLLFHVSDGNEGEVERLMNDLSSDGDYTVRSDMKTVIQKEFYGGWCDERETLSTIKKTFDEYNYLCDTHTAVALNVFEKYKNETGDTTPALVVSTANPYKFPKSVLLAFEEFDGDDFECADKLMAVTASEIPVQLSELKDKKIRFDEVCDAKKMEQVVLNLLQI